MSMPGSEVDVVVDCRSRIANNVAEKNRTLWKHTRLRKDAFGVHSSIDSKLVAKETRQRFGAESD